MRRHVEGIPDLGLWVVPRRCFLFTVLLLLFSSISPVLSAKQPLSDVRWSLEEQEVLLSSLLEALGDLIGEHGKLTKDLEGHSNTVSHLLDIDRAEDAQRLIAAYPPFGDGHRIDPNSLGGPYKKHYVRILAQKQGTAPAMAYVRELPQDEWDLSYLWHAILVSAAERGELIEAQIALSHLSTSRFGGQYRVARAQFEAGQHDAARATLNDMLRELKLADSSDTSRDNLLVSIVYLSLELRVHDVCNASLDFARALDLAHDVAVAVLSRRPSMTKQQRLALVKLVNWSDVATNPGHYLHDRTLLFIASQADSDVVEFVKSSVRPDALGSFEAAFAIARVLVGAPSREALIVEADNKLQHDFDEDPERYMEVAIDLIKLALEHKDVATAKHLLARMVALLKPHIEDLPPRGVPVVVEAHHVLDLAIRVGAWEHIQAIGEWFDAARVGEVYRAWAVHSRTNPDASEEVVAMFSNRADVKLRHRAADAWASIAVVTADEMPEIARHFLDKWQKLGIKGPADVQGTRYYWGRPRRWAAIASDIVMVKALLPGAVLLHDDLELVKELIEAEARREHGFDQEQLWAEWIVQDLTTLIMVLIYADEVDAALELAQWYQAHFPKQREGGEYTQWAGYLGICEFYTGTGDFASALSMSAAIQNVERRSSVLEGIVLALLLDGNIDEATRYARALPRKSQEEMLLKAIGKIALSIQYPTTYSDLLLHGKER